MHVCTCVGLQVGVSMVFVLEVVGLFVFHLVPVLQLALFFKNRYFWFLAVVAVGGLGGAVWWATNPLNAGNVMAIFQVSGGVALGKVMGEGVCTCLYMLGMHAEFTKYLA